MVKILVIANVCTFLIEALLMVHLSGIFGLVPALFWRGFFWQPATYMFLHGGILHLLINMFILWMFGSTLEATWGSSRFIKFYLLCGVGAGILNAAVTPGSMIPTVGASGAIYGLLMAFGILFPNQLILVWGIFPIKAKYFVVVMGAVELFSAMSTAQSNIAHVAHLGGMLFGLIYLKGGALRRGFSSWKADQRRKRHLRVVRDRNEERSSIQREVDELLQKINRNGLKSLTPEENERLRQAGDRMREWDEDE